MTAADRRLVPVFAAAFAALAACSGGSGSGPVAPALVVVDVVPPDGAIDVDPQAEVRVRFAELVAGPLDLALEVADAAGPLPGRLDASPDGKVWRWRPLHDLPRGGRLTVRVVAGLVAGSGARLPADRTAAFTVRDHVAANTFALGSAQPGELAALAWRDGRCAVANGTALEEIGAAGRTPSVVPVAGVTAAWAPTGNSAYAVLALQGAGPYALAALRGAPGAAPFTAVVDTLPGAALRTELAASRGGDLAAYCYCTLPGGAVQERLWWSRRGTVDWQSVALPPAGSSPLRHLAVAGTGDLFAAYVDGATGRLVLFRRAAATGAGETLDVAELPDSFAAGADGQGALVAYRATQNEAGAEVRVLLARRWRPGSGLSAPFELWRGADWTQGPMAVADSGAAAITLRDLPTPTSDERWQVLRLEADGSRGAPATVYAGSPTSAHALTIAPRGEAWLALVCPGDGGRDALLVARSRPGAAPDADRTLYNAPALAQRLRRPSAAVGDGGQFVVAFTEDQVGGSPLVRAVVLE